MTGHNKGPAMDAGVAWRTHCWTAAREALLPTLPIEVLGGRIRRAKEPGLDDKTYAPRCGRRPGMHEGAGSCIIGHAKHAHPGRLTLRTTFGSAGTVDMLVGEQLPRIC